MIKQRSHTQLITSKFRELPISVTLVLYNDTHLKFDDYISCITNRAYQRIGLIFRGFVSNNVNLLKRAYIVYVRPILEYCTCVWSPYLLEDIRKVESVQRYFTRRLFPKNSYSYNERLFLLNLESLESRRLKYDLKMYFKIMNNLTIINPNDFFLFGNIGVTRGHGFKLQKRLFHNNRLSNIFTKQSSWLLEIRCPMKSSMLNPMLLLSVK